MKKKKYHAAPWRCLLRVRRHKPSIAAFTYCEIGAGHCRRCEGCKHYKPQKVFDQLVHMTRLLREMLKNTKFSLTVKPKRKEDNK